MSRRCTSCCLGPSLLISWTDAAPSLTDTQSLESVSECVRERVSVRLMPGQQRQQEEKQEQEQRLQETQDKQKEDESKHDADHRERGHRCFADHVIGVCTEHRQR